MSELWLRYRKLLQQFAWPALNASASLLAVLLLLAQATRPVGLLLVIAITATHWWLTRQRGVRPAHSSRALLLGALTVTTWPASPTWVFALAIAALLAIAMADPAIAELAAERVAAWRLPGFTMPRRSDAASPLFDAASALTVLLALTGLGLPPVGFEICAAAGTAIAALASLRALRAARRQRRLAAVVAALAGYGPRFAILFSGKPEAAYQITMWLPYLERTGEPYVLIVRNRAFLPVARAITTAPVLYAGSAECLGRLLPGIGAVFYVNNDERNAQGVRFTGPTHVHLGHGDSDKPPSYNPSTAMFDEIFVAGQAAIDRYAAHGVLVPAEKFRIVGRPQLEDLQPARVPRPDPPTVLYAPTWRGGADDMGFGSLRHGAEIVAALLRRGAVVTFRPHPFSARDAESRVLIRRIDNLLAAAGPQHSPSRRTAALSIIACLNQADALVTDVSSVASDFLASGKPFAITDLGVVDGALAEVFPVARAAYVVQPGADLDQLFSQLLGADPLAEERARMRSYYLGDPDGSGPSDGFVRAVRQAIEAGRQRG